MSKRTYAVQSMPEQIQELRGLGVLSGGCVALAVARAMAEPGNDEEAIGWIKPVVEKLSTLKGGQGRFERETGSWWGGCSKALLAVGVAHRVVRAEPEVKQVARPGYGGLRDWGYGKRTQALYPTVAQWMRDNPTVKRAVIGTHRHAAFIDHGKVYGANARYRVQVACVIEEEVA